MPAMDSYTFPYLMMLVPFFVWLGVIVFVMMLLVRLVRAVERVAAALERR